MNSKCEILRDVIREALIVESFKDESRYDKDLPRNLSIVDTDCGLAVCIDHKLYGIAIEEVDRT